MSDYRGAGDDPPQMTSPAPLPAQGTAYCYRHPLRETGVRCVRCGRPICPDCMRPASVGFHCPDDVKLGARTIRTARTVAGAPSTTRQPVVTWSLIALNVAVFIGTVIEAGGRLDRPAAARGDSIFHSWQLQPVAVAKGGIEFQRLITSAFLHVNLLHITFNMIALLVVGPFVEQVLGRWRYLSVYLLAALGGSVAVYLFGDHFQPVAGASGAIYGLFAAALVLAQRIKLDMRALLVTIALNFLITFTIPGISVEGHIGGFVVGGLATAAIIWLPTVVPNQPRLVLQVYGMSLLTVLLVVAIAVRTVTFPV
jgi:membrane associated rhomboid family serine protease